MLYQEATRISPLKAPAVIPLMTAGVKILWLSAPDSLFCWHDRRHSHKRHSALQWRRRRSPGLHRHRRRRRLAVGRRSAPLLPRPCQNRCPDPAGSVAAAFCTFATDPHRKVWRKQPWEVTKGAPLHHKIISISCSVADTFLLTSQPRTYKA